MVDVRTLATIVNKAKRRAEVQSVPGDENALRVLYATFFDETPVNRSNMVDAGFRLGGNGVLAATAGACELAYVDDLLPGMTPTSFYYTHTASSTAYPIFPIPKTIGEVRRRLFELSQLP